jgi:hypothetical protein
VELLDNQLTNLWLYLIKLVNQAADRFFYDVGNLEPSEWESLSPLAELKGTILVVSPRAARRADKLRHYPSALRFMLEEGESIKAIAVAGVGSSVLGTASLARSVADSSGWDVAGVVTGYGLADLVVESLGGFYYYGGIDRLRYEFELILDRLLTPAAPATPTGAAGTRSSLAPGYPLGSWDALGNSDVRALYDVLLAGPPRLRLLVGHSKGNLLISFVLNHLKDDLGERALRLRESRHPLFDHLTLVTLGAVVDIPTAAFAMETHQFLGQLDWLGQINSDRSPPFFGTIPIEHEMIPGAGHHLNPRFPCPLSVADALRRAGLPHPEDAPDRGNRATIGR